MSKNVKFIYLSIFYFISISLLLFLSNLNLHTFALQNVSNSTNQNDIFGIKKIYPTKQGGREWFMNMTDPKNDPNIDFTYDPHLIKQNDSLMEALIKIIKFESM